MLKHTICRLLLGKKTHQNLFAESIALGIIVLGIIFMVMPVNAALNCNLQPTCGELGYSLSVEDYCPSDRIIFCPFDMAYKKCLEKSCDALGFTADDKSEWCEDIIECPTDENYTLCASKIFEGCEIGDVYYSDGSCGPMSKYNSSKTAVGVVFYVTNGGKHGKVVNLNDLSVSTSCIFNASEPFSNYFNILPWGLFGTDIAGATNYPSASTLLSKFKANDSGLYNGKSNTQFIANATTAWNNCTNGNNKPGTTSYTKSCTPITAKAALAFYPLKVSSNNAKVGAGQWYIPAIGELAQLYGLDISAMKAGNGTSGATGETKVIVQKTLSALAQKGVNADVFKTIKPSTTFIDGVGWTSDGRYWSSTEAHDSAAWSLSMANGERDTSAKGIDNYIRLIHEY